MDHPNSVKIVEVCMVSPNPRSPSSTSPNSLPLTFFDIRWLRFPPVQRLYFYEMSSSHKSFFNSILEKLKTSLSLTLQHFVPLCGNLTWPQDSPKPILSYVNGDTVSFTIAEYDADFYHLSSSDFLEAEEYHPLVPELEASHERAAVMALQVTVFPNQGLSIGTSMHHAVLDGQTSTSFVKAWAHICKHGFGGSYSSTLLPDKLKPFYDRMVIKDEAGLGELYSNQYQSLDGPNNRSLMVRQIQAAPDSIRGNFKFTRSRIQKLKQHVMTTMAKNEQDEDSDPLLHLSTFSLACAYTWVCLVLAQEVKSEKTLLAFNVDCRSRLHPPIPATYFGNCIAGRVAISDTKGLFAEDGLVLAISAIADALKSLADGVLNGAENWVSRLLAVKTNRVFTCAGSHRFEVYRTDFGWGNPTKVQMVSIDRTRAICFSDAKDSDGGIEVGLVLEKPCMDVFASLFAKGLENL